MNTTTNYCLDNVSKRDAVLSPPLTPALSHPFDKRQSTDMNYPPSQYTRPYPMENYHHWMNPNAPFPMQQQLQQTMAMPPRPTTKPARKQPSKQNKHSCNYPDCQWSFKRYEHLKRHMLVHTGERPHVCPHPGCGKRFSRSDNFHAHYRTHEKKAYYAKQKQQQQQQQQDYAVKEEHEEQQHPSNFMHNPYYQQQQQQYQLLKQQEAFRGYNEERQEVKPHECNDCGKRFRRLEHLKRHMRIHTNEQPFKCSFPGCLKAFSRSDNLTQHKRTHERRKQGDLDDSFAYDLHPIMSWQNPGDTETVGC